MPEQHKDIMQSRFPFHYPEPFANSYTETKESVHSGAQKAKDMFKHKDKEYVASAALHTNLTNAASKAKNRLATTSTARAPNAVAKAAEPGAWTRPALEEWVAKTASASKARIFKAARLAKARAEITLSHRIEVAFWRNSSRVEMKPAT